MQLTRFKLSAYKLTAYLYCTVLFCPVLTCTGRPRRSLACPPPSSCMTRIQDLDDRNDMITMLPAALTSLVPVHVVAIVPVLAPPHPASVIMTM